MVEPGWLRKTGISERADMAESENRFAELDQLPGWFDVAEKQEQTP